MSRHKCFLIEKTSNAKYYLRRWGGEGCTDGYGYHQAMSYYTTAPLNFSKNDDSYEGTIDKPEDDFEQWPTKCDHCDYNFSDDETRQLFVEQIYVSASGEEYTLWQIRREKIIGAMWDAWWAHESWMQNGKCYAVFTPGGEWCLGQPSAQGGHWTWTGTAPELTATPSILIKHHETGDTEYHGYLKDGYLESTSDSPQ